MMRCPNCSYEGESRFCPECGGLMEEVKVSTEKACPNCGELTDAKFCPNCGHSMNVPEKEPIQAEPAFGEGGSETAEQFPEQGETIRWTGAADAPREKRSHKKVIIIIIVAVAAVIVAAIVAFAVVVRGFTDNAADRESDTNDTAASEEVIADDESSAEGMTEVETQGKELPGGSYVVGEDFAAGKYNFTYTTEMSEDDYWSNDYIYITRNGSEGTEETLGGTKFDERFGSVEYDSATKGKSFYANLKSGDKLVVESDYGTWTY